MGHPEEVRRALLQAGVARGALVALALDPTVGVGVAWAGGAASAPADPTDPDALVRVVAGLEADVRPRWVLWSSDTASTLVADGLRVATAWDVSAVHRLLEGGWQADAGRCWAAVHDLPATTVPALAPPDLFNQPDPAEADPSGPLRPDGHLRPEWVGGAWAADEDHLRRWAELALQAASGQQARLDALAGPDRRVRWARTARSESTAELLCAELAHDGLPVDREVAEAIVAAVVGERPRTEAEAAEQRARRDADVLRHAPPGGRFDLRSPGQVRSLLRFVGIEVPDTRAWRLEALRDAHPLVEALLAWRKAERVANTYGYAWLDEHVGPDGRLRGSWSGADGGAGRMTASAGLHNLPADLRPAVVAGPGHVFVRADLGQIEPRVLAAVSGDAALARASQEPDLYAPVAAQLGVDRATAKVAVLGALYGQTTGHGAQVLPRLRATYPVAMAYLEAGDRTGQAGGDLRTHGGRLVRTGSVPSGEQDRSRAAAQGRFGRNALVQGAAAELFKVWAVVARARTADLGARLVLCLHDELLVHAPASAGAEVAVLVDEALQEAAHHWTDDRSVRFLADTSVIDRWSDAKG